jgi:DNA-binding response OmpR family regulator
MPEPSLTILLIENDRYTRELYQQELEQEYQVLACSSENEALALIHRHSVCAIILEPNLPSEQGWNFLALLKTLPKTRSTPIILCTTQDERRLGLKLGATLYLIKPVLPALLLKQVHRVIDSSVSS